MTFTHALATNNYGPAKFIVDSNAANGTHTTIASALTSASSGDTIVIRPGSYTENLTLKAGVNLTAWLGDGDNPQVTIIGKATFTAAGTATISNVRLQTNSDFLLAVTGSNASIVNLNRCFLNCTNNTGISHTASNTSSAVNINNCRGDLGTTGIAWHVSTSTGNITYYYFNSTNSGGSSTASSVSAATCFLSYGFVFGNFSSSSTGSIFAKYVDIRTSGNAIAIDHQGNVTAEIRYCRLDSGSGAAINIGAGSNIVAQDNVLNSSAASVVTGTGTFQFGLASCLLTNTLAAGLTLNNTDVMIVKNLQYSTPTGSTGSVVSNLMQYYEEGTWTPTMVGSTLAGSTTYVAQVGYYTKIGQVVYVWGRVQFSAATGTGDTTFGALPFTVKNQSSYFPNGSIVVDSAGITWPTGCTCLNIRGVANSTNMIVAATGSTKAQANLQMANTSGVITFSLMYQV